MNQPQPTPKRRIGATSGFFLPFILMMGCAGSPWLAHESDLSEAVSLYYVAPEPYPAERLAVDSDPYSPTASHAAEVESFDLLHGVQPGPIELLPPEHPFSYLCWIRGRHWPLVRNWGGGFRHPPETGIASFYYRPQPLATTGIFRPEAITAAHKKLPFGTIVRATRTDTGQSVIVVINDRGPYIDGRIIDLSLGAARRMNMIDDGVVPIRLDILAYPIVEVMGPKGSG